MKNEKILNTVLFGNCLKKLKQIEDNSIDSIVTDPPYQLDNIIKRHKNSSIEKEKYIQKKLEVNDENSVHARAIVGFLGKTWDVLPSVQTWKECFRVLKPGGFAFIMTTPRQDSLCQLLTNLTAAGFNMGFSSIYWSYSSGFPKAMNISKQIDRRNGVEPTVIGYAKNNPDFKDRGKNVKELHGLNKLGVGVGSTRQQTPITVATSNDAKKFEGAYAGYQPKPSVEIIIVCMKPLEKNSYIDQALDNGKGVTYLDNCRIPYADNKDYIDYKEKQESFQNSKTIGKTVKGKTKFLSGDIEKLTSIPNDESKGRFPSNLLVSDDALNNGKRQSTGHWTQSKITGYGRFGDGSIEYNGVGNKETVDSYSKYFDVDIWYDNVIKNLPEDVQKTFPFLICSKPSTREKNIGLELNEKNGTVYNRKCLKCGKWQIAQKGKNGEKYKCKCKEPQFEEPKGNTHPTIKPIKLMSYLITLGSREGDVILDPFSGSGTTLIAAAMLNRNFIGIELEKEYYSVIEKRLNAIPEYIKEYKDELKLKLKTKEHKFW